jgi:hypothetical protein|tara:strand:+ start:1229 stop:1492 length:264 start_codon:yes stop_codon:yes gene_type:complete
MRTQKPLPNPPDEYDKTYMFDLASLVIDEESVSVKTDRDNVLDKGSLVLRSPNGSYFKIVVADNGALAASAVTTVDNRPVTSTNPYV